MYCPTEGIKSPIPVKDFVECLGNKSDKFDFESVKPLSDNWPESVVLNSLDGLVEEFGVVFTLKCRLIFLVDRDVKSISSQSSFMLARELSTDFDNSFLLSSLSKEYTIGGMHSLGASESNGGIGVAEEYDVVTFFPSTTKKEAYRF